MRRIFAGAAAGAAGTTALNAATYLDMVVRGRSSSTPEQTVEAIEDKVPASIPGDGDVRDRVSGLGSLSGIATGVGVAMGVLRRAGLRLLAPTGSALTGLLAMAVTDSLLAGLKVSDPRTWSARDWAADAVPISSTASTPTSACRHLSAPDIDAGTGHPLP